MNKLKAYIWMPQKDSDSCICIIAESVKEAKKMGWNFWACEYGNDYDFYEQRCNQLKEKKYGKINIEGLSKGPVIDILDGLKRGLYGYAEEETCPRCLNEGCTVFYDNDKNEFSCYACQDNDKCDKCNKYHYPEDGCE